ncbi:MAG: hypothetical protein OXI96_02085 [Acidimicrobiaceae bacterium]|nr:hypothetical protein [Acidimicrobiaceae bacterium]
MVVFGEVVGEASFEFRDARGGGIESSGDGCESQTVLDVLVAQVHSVGDYRRV